MWLNDHLVTFRYTIVHYSKITIGSPQSERVMTLGSISLILLMFKLIFFLYSPSTLWIKFDFSCISVYTLTNSNLKITITDLAVTQTRMSVSAQPLLTYFSLCDSYSSNCPLVNWHSGFLKNKLLSHSPLFILPWNHLEWRSSCSKWYWHCSLWADTYGANGRSN